MSGQVPTKLVVANSPNVSGLKIGNSTISIKPAPLSVSPSPVVVTTNDPPPLAPLSIQSNKAGIKQITLTPNTSDGTKVLVSPSQKITANKMLVDLLDKKAPEPPVFTGTTIKRKIDMESEVPSKKADTESGDVVTPSSKAADLYAKLAGSILEDEEMEDEIEKAIPTKIIEKKVIEVKPGVGGSQQQIITSSPVQRQIIVGPNNQMILSPNAGSHQTTATIKTDSGIQTVPIILPNNAIQGMPGQTLIQQQAPTQYILATNPQGQTYVVAQQPMPQPQTVLLAQTPHQQGTQTKTIIILQQNQGQQNQSGIQQIQVSPQGQQQKIIMTPSGQQVIYSTQRPFGQQQVFQNYQQGGNIHTTIIQSGTTQSMTNRKIVFTNSVDGQTTPGGAKIIQAVQQSPTQHTLQSLTQGQNIIMQKGQKFQIGNTQISQVISQPHQQQHQQQHQAQQQVQIVQRTPQRIESPPVIVNKDANRATESSNSNSPSLSVAIQDTKSNESSDVHAKADELIDLPKESPSVLTSSANTSGASSPAPSQAKQQVSIQIPVPQSQVVGPNAQQYSIKVIPPSDISKIKDEDVDPSWPFMCDWRGCPKKKFASANEVYLHACAAHCPSLEGTPDLFCQWGGGNNLCDNLPRKRFSLMTHIFDRHCTAEAFKMAVQKRLAVAESGVNNAPNKLTYPVTVVRQLNNPQAQSDGQNVNLMNGPTNIQNAGAAAMQAIKRHAIEFNIAKEQMVS